MLLLAHYCVHGPWSFSKHRLSYWFGGSRFLLREKTLCRLRQLVLRLEVTYQPFVVSSEDAGKKTGKGNIQEWIQETPSLGVSGRVH